MPPWSSHVTALTVFIFPSGIFTSIFHHILCTVYECVRVKRVMRHEIRHAWSWVLVNKGLFVPYRPYRQFKHQPLCQCLSPTHQTHTHTLRPAPSRRRVCRCDRWQWCMVTEDSGCDVVKEIMLSSSVRVIRVTFLPLWGGRRVGRGGNRWIASLCESIWRKNLVWVFYVFALATDMDIFVRVVTTTLKCQGWGHLPLFFILATKTPGWSPW